MTLARVILLFAITSLIFDSTWAKSKTYIVHMDKTAMPKAFSTHQSWFHSTLASISETPLMASKLIHTYTNSMHGFSATLTPSELETLKSFPGYLHSFPDRPVKPHTTHTPKFLGLNPSSGVWPASSYGKDVVIGVLDSGVWPESESFSDEGMTRVPASWRGRCEGGEGFNASLCNKKLVGVRFFNKATKVENPSIAYVNSARDETGHGTHTASTAAGNFVEGASFYGYAPGTASGMAPRARLSIYKVLWENSGTADFYAAMDRAIEDGVDVLSLSVGTVRFPISSDNTLSDDWMSVATFAAMERGIFLSTSAGNDGPGIASLENGGPWLTTVGAGTVDRQLRGEFVLGNGVRFSFVSIYPGKASNSPVGLVLIKDCAKVKRISKFRKKIVVCQGDEDLEVYVVNSMRAKVYGAVFVTNLTMHAEDWAKDQFPKMFLNPKEGQALISYVEKDENPTGKFEFRRTTLLGTKPAPKVGVFSSRGPFLYCSNFLKPDILAPGSLILAAWPTSVPASTLLSGREIYSRFNFDSGTSMAAPHVSGIAALIKSVHPKWSPAAIRSAMMTTAHPLDNTGTPIGDEANLFVPGFDGGAGHIAPNAAVDPGLVYDISPEDYVAFLCGLNYTAKQIQIITKAKHTCAKRSDDLNYPSFLAYFNGRGKSVWKFTRTVTNVGKATASYTAKLTEMSELKLSVDPKKLVFKKKYEKLSYKLVLEGPKVLSVKSVLGFLSWVEDSGKHFVRSPIVATSIDPQTFKEKP